jgi:hypothetical protein
MQTRNKDIFLRKKFKVIQKFFYNNKYCQQICKRLPCVYDWHCVVWGPFWYNSVEGRKPLNCVWAPRNIVMLVSENTFLECG